MGKIVVIVGSTATGKTELAIDLAKKFGGEVISADSRQVYKGLDIGSGKVTKKEMKGITHHLIDVASPKRTFSVTRYQHLAKKALKEITKRNTLPIVAGGTGFYIDALLYNYNLPIVPPQKKLRDVLERKHINTLYEELKKLDPRRAKNIDRKNKRRLIRAIEILKTTGEEIPLLSKKKSKYKVLKIGIKRSPDELKKLISARLRKRLKEGMIEEVEGLHQDGVSWRRLDELGLEYRYVSRYLRDLITKKEMIEILEREIYKYAKRQITWFGKHKDIRWTSSPSEAEKLVNDFLK